MSHAPRAAIRARTASDLDASVVAETPLLYDQGADPALDRPAHVRAGSGLAWFGDRLVVVQDDANFLALVEPRTARAGAVTLPPGPGGVRLFEPARGNKLAKLDLESCVVLSRPEGELLLAFGSGSAPERERVLVASGLLGPDPRVRLVPVPRLYRALREARDFSGAELNVEGAAVLGPDLVLFQRGNGAARGGLVAVDATCRLALAALLAHLEAPERAPAPEVREATSYDLGAADGVRLTFTDAATRGGTLFYLASAEASPDAVEDGPVAGVALGFLEAGGAARHVLIRDAAGHPFRAKAEGLAFDPVDPALAWAVLDVDDPARPSRLCRILLAGPWPGSAVDRRPFT